MKLELIATATFGLEAVVRREIEALGYKVLKSEDGKITYLGDERAIVRSNLWLRTADRVLLKVGEFTAGTFEDLYQVGTLAKVVKVIRINAGSYSVVLNGIGRFHLHEPVGLEPFMRAGVIRVDDGVPDLADDKDPERAASLEKAKEIERLAAELRDKTRQALGPAVAGHDAELHFRLAKPGILARQAERAGHGEFAAAAQSIAVHRRDDGFAQVFDQVEHVLAEERKLLAFDRRLPGQFVDVGAGHK